MGQDVKPQGGQAFGGSPQLTSRRRSPGCRLSVYAASRSEEHKDKITEFEGIFSLRIAMYKEGSNWIDVCECFCGVAVLSFWPIGRISAL